jgi:SAM-dependent methyltransferase
MTDHDLSAFQHPRFARMYVDAAKVADQRGGRQHREKLVDGLAGRVIEIGAGNGRNFTHYDPETVTEVVAVEPDDTLRAYAAVAARTAPVPVSVVAGHAEQLPDRDGRANPDRDRDPDRGRDPDRATVRRRDSGGAGQADAFDAAVVSLVLCTVPSLPRALAEIARVLKPGGELRFYEHVRSVNPCFGLLEDLICPAWKRLAGGCHPNRDTLTAISTAGFFVEHVERFGFSPQPVLPQIAHLLGRARLPTSD